MCERIKGHRKALWRILAIVVTSIAVSACGSTPASITPAAPSVLQVPPVEGKLAYVREGDVWLWQAGEARQLTTGGTWRQPALSADGAEIAYVNRERNFADVFAMPADGSSSRRLTRGQASTVGDNDWSFRPAWSPDGSQIAYISDANSYFPVVWLMNKEGGAKRQIMTAAMDLDVADAMSWAPDGRRLAVTAMNREGSQIYLLDATRQAIIEKFTNHSQGAFDPAWSPDGETIAYVAREGGRLEVRLKRAEKSGEGRSDRLAYVRSPAWSPDGRSLAVLSAQGGSFDVWVASVETGGDELQIGEFRQLTRDGGIDAVSGLSWAK